MIAQEAADMTTIGETYHITLTAAEVEEIREAIRRRKAADESGDANDWNHYYEAAKDVSFLIEWEIEKLPF